jgi:pyruvate formate lyase activating enzyme
MVDMISGRILHLQRLSTEDGPGIRTTVFFKGCPLHCPWCHNPESLPADFQIQWFVERCLGCRTCLSACPEGCLAMGEGGELVIDRECCPGCAICAQACPASAIEPLGKQVAAGELLQELLKDRAFYEKSGGGVTLSGGEPTLQPDFAEALLHGLKEQGISTALDTCGLCSPRVLDRLLPLTDLVLYDLKLFDPVRHQAIVGLPNRQILNNLIYIREMILSRSLRTQLWIRTPLIPGATCDDENLLSLGRFIAQNLDGCTARWELCAFNNLCRDKYQRLGLTWAYAQTPLMTAGELAHCAQTARLSGVAPEIVRATGAVRPNYLDQDGHPR